MPPNDATASKLVKDGPAEEYLDLDKDFPEFQGWESVGFHRGLGREFWQLMLEIIGLAASIFIISLLMPILQPFPEIRGYQSVAGGLFTLVYTVFDIGTNFGLNRFIAEYRVKDVRKMLQYVSFTIWWQSFTGLIQISALTWFSFEVLVNTNYAYLIWILLLGLQKQFPGWLGLFRGVLEGMQHFDKVEIIHFLQTEIVERLTTIGFVLLFRWYGEMNPAYGIMMGIIIGNLIGGYVDDIVFEFIGAYYLHKILKKYFGLSLRDCFRVKYDKDVLRDIWFYSLQGAALPLLGSFVGTFTLLTLVNNINAYTTWTAIVATGMSFAGQIRQFGDFSLQTSIAEAYPSGKRTLSEFYVTYSLKWRYLFMLLLAFIIIGIYPFTVVLIEELPAFHYYQGAQIFIIAGIIARLLDPILQAPDAIMWGAKHITAFNVIRVVDECLKLYFIWLFVIVLRIQDTWGLFGLTYLLGFTHYIPTLIKTAICYIYIQKRILHVKVYWRATLIIPIIASLPNIAMAQFWYYTAFFPMKTAIGLELTLVISVIIFFVVILVTYFPLIALLGGLDDYQMFVFKKAVDISGPSKPVFKLVYGLMKRSVSIAKKWGWHGRYAIPYQDAHREIRELMEIKRSALKAQLATNKN